MVPMPMHNNHDHQIQPMVVEQIDHDFTNVAPLLWYFKARSRWCRKVAALGISCSAH